MNHGVGSGVGLDDDGGLEMRGGCDDVGKLAREDPEHQMLAALLDQPERGCVPECRCPTESENDLEAGPQVLVGGQVF